MKATVYPYNVEWIWGQVRVKDNPGLNANLCYLPDVTCRSNKKIAPGLHLLLRLYNR